MNRRKRASKIELCFDIVSIIFLMSCLCFFGYRMFYYKNKLSPKDSNNQEITLLTSEIKKNTINDGDGLYNVENIFIYKGKDVNNYIEYSNMLFRIIKINKDNTIEMILDDTLNYLSYDKENSNYKSSNLNKYLNDIFYNNIKSDLLVKSPYCSDNINNINKISCNDIEIDYIKLLSLNDYLNSKNNDRSYLDSENIIWLSNNNEDNVWVLNNGNLSLVLPDSLYQVKPVITLNNLTKYISGDGSLENPYRIEDNELYFASYVKLDNDLYRVNEINDEILKLQLNDVYNDGNIKYSFSNKNNVFNINDGLGEYLNNTIYNELTYKDLLIDCNTYIEEYNFDYSSVLKNKIKSKVGINSIIEPIFNGENKNNYYLSTPYDSDQIYIYNNSVYSVKTNIIRNINFNVCINKNKISDGDGSLNNPYVINSEVSK
jgi:hypothetical protein